MRRVFVPDTHSHTYARGALAYNIRFFFRPYPARDPIALPPTVRDTRSDRLAVPPPPHHPRDRPSTCFSSRRSRRAATKRRPSTTTDETQQTRWDDDGEKTDAPPRRQFAIEPQSRVRPRRRPRDVSVSSDRPTAVASCAVRACCCSVRDDDDCAPRCAAAAAGPSPDARSLLRRFAITVVP